MIGVSFALLAAPILPGLETGQSINFVSRMDCQIQSGKFDLNGAAHSSHGPAASSIAFLFASATDGGEVPVVMLETSTSGSTSPSNAQASSLPRTSATPQPPVSILVGEGLMMSLSSRYGHRNDVWDYSSTQVAVHGALITEKGVCKLTSEVDE